MPWSLLFYFAFLFSAPSALDGFFKPILIRIYNYVTGSIVIDFAWNRFKKPDWSECAGGAEGAEFFKPISRQIYNYRAGYIVNHLLAWNRFKKPNWSECAGGADGADGFFKPISRQIYNYRAGYIELSYSFTVLLEPS